jgi:hypothetical protein
VGWTNDVSESFFVSDSSDTIVSKLWAGRTTFRKFSLCLIAQAACWWTDVSETFCVSDSSTTVLSKLSAGRTTFRKPSLSLMARPLYWVNCGRDDRRIGFRLPARSFFFPPNPWKLPYEQSGRRKKLNTHLHQVSRLSIRGTIPPHFPIHLRGVMPNEAREWVYLYLYHLQGWCSCSGLQ